MTPEFFRRVIARTQARIDERAQPAQQPARAKVLGLRANRYIVLVAGAACGALRVEWKHGEVTIDSVLTSAPTFSELLRAALDASCDDLLVIRLLTEEAKPGLDIVLCDVRTIQVMPGALDVLSAEPATERTRVVFGHHVYRRAK